MSSRITFTSLERIPQRKLNDARITGCRGNRSKCSGCTPLHSRIREICMIERIEELRAKLNGLHFPNARHFAECDVPIGLARTKQDSDAGIPEFTRACNRE